MALAGAAALLGVRACIEELVLTPLRFLNDCVQKFALDGTFLTGFGSSGDSSGQFRHTIAVDVSSDGTGFVADFLNHRIQKWRPKREAGDPLPHKNFW